MLSRTAVLVRVEFCARSVDGDSLSEDDDISKMRHSANSLNLNLNLDLKKNWLRGRTFPLTTCFRSSGATWLTSVLQAPHFVQSYL